MKRALNILADIGISLLAGILALVYFLYLYGIVGMIITLSKSSKSRFSHDIIEKKWSYFMVLTIVNLLMWSLTIAFIFKIF